MDTTGNRIRAARIAAGLTQTELAEKIGVKFSAIHKYEAGLVVNIKRTTIDKLAEALNVRPSYLLCVEDEAEAPTASEDDIKFALFGGGGDITDDMYEEVKRFAAYVLDRERKKKG